MPHLHLTSRADANIAIRIYPPLGTNYGKLHWNSRSYQSLISTHKSEASIMGNSQSVWVDLKAIAVQALVDGAKRLRRVVFFGLPSTTTITAS
jgi:hypothetical protein